MVGRSGGGDGGGGFDYVQDPSPQEPKEGEEWYDTGSNAAYVYDGAEWIEQTIVDHGQLSGIGASDHHSRPTSTNNASNTDSFIQYVSAGNAGGDGRNLEQPVRQVTDAVEFRYNDNSADGSADFYVRKFDGTEIESWSISTNGDDNWHTETRYYSPEATDHLEVNTTDYESVEINLRPVVVPSHSHSI